MKLLLPHPYPELHPLARMRVWHRLLAAIAVGAAIAFVLPAALWETRLLDAWLGGCLTYLGIVWIGVGRLDAAHTRQRAASYDPGAATLYAVVVATAFVSLVGVLLVTDAARWLHIALALATLCATWLLIQTVYALRYARHYYTGDACGLLFPGDGAPTYSDFAYFAAVIGMTSQVSDVAIASAPMRRLALAHGQA